MRAFLGGPGYLMFSAYACAGMTALTVAAGIVVAFGHGVAALPLGPGVIIQVALVRACAQREMQLRAAARPGD